MSNFKPSITVTTRESLRDYRNDYSNKKRSYLYIPYKTYKELKKDIPRLLNESVNGTLSVSRSKRGEWGEWFEEWMAYGKKGKIIKDVN
jgi:hypothetical protein